MLFNFKRAASLTLAFLFTFLILTSCTKRVETIPEPESHSFINLLPIPEKPELSAIPPLDLGLVEKALEKYKLNDDTMGWLNIEGTTLDDEVMYHKDTKDKFYYLRKDFYGNYSFAGTYFLDYRSKFDGGREGLSRNNVIYGHSMTDNPDDTLFSQLKKYKKEEFAKKTPYVYFSTIEEDMAWEVFAVYVTNINFPYNMPNPDDEKFEEIIKDAKSKSIYNYDVEVGKDDKILTLSTCLYEVNGQKVSYPNNYRYVVMAKLVPSTEILKETANFEINESPVAA